VLAPKLTVPLAEFERDLIRERTNAGVAAARASGRNGGRPTGVDQKKQQAALALQHETTHSIRAIGDSVGIARNTDYQYTRTDRQPSPPPPQAHELHEH
jgi:DNA invertase Pin-like site-specific DNA recombinase